MVTKKQKTILIACSAISLNLSAGEFFYTVKRGETLSDILYNLNSDHIYGKLGELKKTLKLNSWISKRRGNKIFPGEKIKLALVNNEQKIELTEQNRTEQNRTEQPLIRKARDSLRRNSARIINHYRFTQNFTLDKPSFRSRKTAISKRRQRTIHFCQIRSASFLDESFV